MGSEQPTGNVGLGERYVTKTMTPRSTLARRSLATLSGVWVISIAMSSAVAGCGDGTAADPDASFSSGGQTPSSGGGSNAGGRAGNAGAGNGGITSGHAGNAGTGSDSAGRNDAGSGGAGSGSGTGAPQAGLGGQSALGAGGMATAGVVGFAEIQLDLDNTNESRGAYQSCTAGSMCHQNPARNVVIIASPNADELRQNWENIVNVPTGVTPWVTPADDTAAMLNEVPIPDDVRARWLAWIQAGAPFD